jgi:hypothetical protein
MQKHLPLAMYINFILLDLHVYYYHQTADTSKLEPRFTAGRDEDASDVPSRMVDRRREYLLPY